MSCEGAASPFPPFFILEGNRGPYTLQIQVHLHSGDCFGTLLRKDKATLSSPFHEAVNCSYTKNLQSWSAS